MKVTSKSRTVKYLETIKHFEHIIQTMEEHRGSYFWTSWGNASDRRRREFREEYMFEIFGDKIDITLERRDSVRNVYFTQDIYFNGKKSNITKIKNILKKMKEIVEKREGRKSV